MPAGFSPEEWIESGRNPGLGIRALHRQGITGEGVTVAVVDKPIHHTHRQFRGRIHYHEVFDGAEGGRAPHFHGIACASILPGDYRTTASNKGEELYVYWGTGGVYRGRQGAAGPIDVRRA